MRTPAGRGSRPRKTSTRSFLPPTGGWISNRNIAAPRGRDLPPGASILENWFPTATSIILRRGSRRWASLPGGPCTSLFTYSNGSQLEMFAATDTGVWNVTTVTDPYTMIIGTDDGDYIGTDDDEVFGWDSVDGLQVMGPNIGGDWVTVQFSTAGGTFLVGVNGSDPALLYDGTSFSAAAITFPAGVTKTTADLSYVWNFKNRLWFIEKNTLDAWYLDVDQIGGELTKFPLGGTLNLGGALLFGASWSLDRSQSGGLGAQCVFATVDGEVAVYQGSNPEEAADWSLVGVYRIGKPLGHKAHIQAGGDIVVATAIGFVPLSQAVARDYAAIAPSDL